MGKKDKSKEKNTETDIQFEKIDPGSVRCNDCVFKAKNVGGFNGATLARCECYPKNDKPMDILVQGVDCVYYCGDF